MSFCVIKAFSDAKICANSTAIMVAKFKVSYQRMNHVCVMYHKRKDLSFLNPNWHEAGPFPPLPFWIRFLAAEFLSKKNFFGGEN